MQNNEINDVDDLLRLLESRPGLAERVRQVLFGEDMSALSDNVNALSKAVKELSDTTGKLSPALDMISKRVDEAEGHLGNLAGDSYEEIVEPKLIARAMTELGMRSPRTVLSRKGNMNARFTSRLQECMDRITESQDPEQIRKAVEALGEIHNTDLIIEGNGPTYAVCEISLTVERYDVERALERAEALRWLSGSTVKAVVVGETVPDEERRRAETGGAQHFTLINR